MKVCFVHNDNTREIHLASAFCEGVAKGGDQYDMVLKSGKLHTDCDVVCMVGVKSDKIFRQARNAGKDVIFFDKGYFRHRGEQSRTWEYWRVAVNDHHPTTYISKAKHGPRRWELISTRLAVSPKPWRRDGNHVLYAGSSAKYHTFANLPPPTEYATEVVSGLKARTNRLIVYRPKPSWHEAIPVSGASYSDESENITAALRNCWCLVTAGSNASFDAIMNGIPTIILGDAIARPISSHSLEDIESPLLPSDKELKQWLANIAWCMFTEREMRQGLTWQAVKAQLMGSVLRDEDISWVADETPAGNRAEARRRLFEKKHKGGQAKNKKMKKKLVR